jgi:hypothetical protein
MILLRLQHRSLFDRVAWIAVLAMLLPVFLPLLHHMGAQGISSPMPPCHMASMVHMAKIQGMDDRAVPSKPASKTPPCPICQILGSLHNGFITPLVVGTGGYFLGNLIAYSLQTQGVLFSQTHQLAWPRAPPSLI